MPITFRNSEEALFGIPAVFNADRRAIVRETTTFPHAEITHTAQGGDYRNPTVAPLLVTAATAVGLATGIAIANQASNILDIHFADTYAHDAADEANVLGLTDLASDATQGALNTRLNAIKVACLAHVDETDVHFTDDGDNTIAAADATDDASAQTLANAIKTFINAHIQLAWPAPMMRVGPA